MYEANDRPERVDLHFYAKQKLDIVPNFNLLHAQKMGEHDAEIEN